MRIAVAGVGSMGRNHVRVLMDLPEVQLVGLADPNVEGASAVARKYNVPVYADYRDLLSEQRPQALVVAVPTVLHRDVTVEALSRGVHVLVEKPIAGTEAEAVEMIGLAERQGLVLAVGHIERFNPAVIELKKRIDAGELGRVFMIHARRQSPYPRRIQDVGVAFDLATHELDMMHYLTGSRVIQVQSDVERVMASGREDIVFGLLRFENGVLGILDVNWVTPTTVRELTITGERGMFVVNYLSQELSFHENPAAHPVLDGTTWDFSVDAGHMTRFQIVRKEPLRSELEAFLRAIREQTRPVVDGSDGLEAWRLAARIMTNGTPASNEAVGPLGQGENG